MPSATHPARHVLYLAWGFPPAAKSCAYRTLATANAFARAGWAVTVVTLTEDAWSREHGLDRSLLPLVDPSIIIERLPLYREDLETDIRRYSALRTRRPAAWLAQHRREDEEAFPEPVFGRWHDRLVASVDAIHARDPADLVVATAAPYTFFAPALELWEREQVPFVLDYRDAWAIDIIRDRAAFEPDSRQGRFERRLFDAAHEAWFVNGPIRDAYAELYPDRADALHVVRNGSDVAVGTDRIPQRAPDPAAGLTFGYLGTVTFGPELTEAVCEGWRLARERDELLSRSRLEFRGHIGAGAARGVSGHARIIAAHADDGISHGGPVDKADTASVYASWDALLLLLVGGRYVTSGKVYDYVSTGLPIMSAHAKDHAATEVLKGYPLWVANESLEAQALADAFVRTARLAVTATPEQRQAAREHAARFERYAQIQPAVDRLSEQFGVTAPRDGAARPEAGQVHGPPVETRLPPAHLTGRTVVLVHTRPLLDVVLDGMRRMRGAGARVVVVGPQPPAGVEHVDHLEDGVASEWIRLPRPDGPSGTPPTGSAARAVDRLHRLVGRVARRAVGAPLLWAASARLHRATRLALAEGDVLTALDPDAVRTVWEAARRNTSAAAVNGLGPTLELLGLSR